MIERVHFLVSGHVQGVGFRQATQARARQLGLRGWVRNLADGRVEGEAAGATENLQALQSWLLHGPQQATVDQLHWLAESAQATDLATDQPFGIRATADAALR